MGNHSNPARIARRQAVAEKRGQSHEILSDIEDGFALKRHRDKARPATSYWPAAGVGEGVGDINPFAACSPACFAPVSATELMLGL